MTDYSEWNAKTNQLLSNLESEDKEEQEQVKQELGLQDGKYPRSKAEADEQSKAKHVKKMKHVLDKYRKKEESVQQILSNVWKDDESQQQEVQNVVTAKEGENQLKTRYITCNDVDAGKRVLTLSDTDGPGHIILTQDLSHLVCAMPTNATLTPKTYPEDAENSVQEEKKDPSHATKTIYGLIKVHLTNLHNVTISIRCKVITGLLEISHCSNLLIKIEKESTIVTAQADVCQNITIQFHDVPSGGGGGGDQSILPMQSSPLLYWGEDKDDRIFHAGVSNLKVEVYRDGCMDLQTRADYEENGAISVGNASAEEVQFVTSVLDGELVTEKVLKPGSLTGTTVVGGVGGESDKVEGSCGRAMTAREMKEVEQRKELIKKAVNEKLGGIKILDKNGKEVPVVKKSDQEVDKNKPPSEAKSIVIDCEAQKTKGNEAFVAGEYAQAILLYTLALDKATELLDTVEANDSEKELFPRHVVLSNRSACFLKLGYHEKALADGIDAEKIEPSYVKGVFRKGLALHAMGRYQEATISLAAALKLEPKNKQIKRALQFADVRLQQDMRKRMSR
mmetsp:Transcript_3765/g.4292  ORF Transcript_3765/g.4292 Transcript_3765/m.4292 type:complete len:564 (+) Transcript_3765:77-1768(+)|eukprot:CAMPEP_0198263198 /NCGR_PEP_ID=MMETSP1447-20131203/11592_1 /TAXON_ID=420782 /ORGANISM="Chaetoceros dichaeta, Strain CCMP1751" /LENGTH=563 /DNA_ID=CAMNT_0043951713 /DNA_START=82 /DNA_END=1773 /DNA_ORIENTATION=+